MRWIALLALMAGCATAPRGVRLASAGMPEAMCRHCNCLMPAGIDPDALCPVCECGRKAHECVRGR